MALITDNSGQKNSLQLGGNIVMVALLVVSLALVLLYSRESEEGPLHTVQNSVSSIVTPFKFVGGAAGAGINSAGDAIENATASDGRLTSLKEENAALKVRIAELEENNKEAERLRGLLNVKETYSLETVNGRIVNRKSDAWNQVVTVNVGSKDGVELGLPVVGSTGLIGQVIAVTPLTCDVRLVSDPQSGISVFIQSNRALGVVNGSLEGLIYLENVDPSVNVKQGDVILTSGMGGSFPKGIVVGTVANVENPAGTADRKITISLYSSSDPLEEVSIVTKMNADGPQKKVADPSKESTQKKDKGEETAVDADADADTNADTDAKTDQVEPEEGE